jgi:hypothetical protein
MKSFTDELVAEVKPKVDALTLRQQEARGYIDEILQALSIATGGATWRLSSSHIMMKGKLYRFIESFRPRIQTANGVVEECVFPLCRIHIGVAGWPVEVDDFDAYSKDELFDAVLNIISRDEGRVLQLASGERLWEESQ